MNRNVNLLKYSNKNVYVLYSGTNIEFLRRNTYNTHCCSQDPTSIKKFITCYFIEQQQQQHIIINIYNDNVTIQMHPLHNPRPAVPVVHGVVDAIQRKVNDSS